jgi:hypothetical protein
MIHTHLIRIERILKGTSQLYSAMNKGFDTVESDTTLLLIFKDICFDANQKIEEILPVLKQHIEQTSNMDDNLLSSENYGNIVFNDLIILKEVIHENIQYITEYIDSFTDSWNKSFSINALMKFKSLLTNEYSALESEIQSIEMENLLKNRKQKINLHRTALKIAEDTGLSNI